MVPKKTAATSPNERYVTPTWAPMAVYVFRIMWITAFGRSGSLSVEVDHPVSVSMNARR